MKSMKYKNGLIERLDNITHEVTQLKSILIYQAIPDKARSSSAWKDLLLVVDEVSTRWSGHSALQEIRAQREH